ncbi:IclR family transcriptional regulator [Notoacmeibacter ruber]|uniref:IclR family transcriptional regulator n=1 Tax=Notoacmeibacter ruber TaxID=2670375 RepID=A0A3L7J438_9HYPH|nr:IclR family transcriptional regulator [Notoacmeibacter ruber]RLQ85219.1 IclR family transcriptional regulator [Notoacmeibacter ruber]
MDEKDDLDDRPASGKRSGTINSVSVAARFLHCLANAPKPLPLGAIAEQTESGSSTAHRYMQSLIKEGLAVQDPTTGLYDLGPMALSIGIAAIRRIDGVEIASRHMKTLVSETMSSGGVAIWTERGPTLVRWYRNAYFSISSLGLGDILPIDNSACGLCFQAFLPPERIESARRLQPPHFRGRKVRAGDLEKIRHECWAELTGHLLPTITGLAVPVFDAQNEIVCVMTTVTDLGQNRSANDAATLFAHARKVALQTGGSDCLELSAMDGNVRG